MRNHVLILLCLVLLFSGCGVREPSQWQEWRNQFALKDHPEGTISISEAILKPQDEEIFVLAQVGSGKGDTFDNKFATFLISEAPDKDHMGKVGHDDDCPFCKMRLANAPTVSVGFESPPGKVIPVDARRLFGIKKGDVVVVKGKGTYEESTKMLTLNATGLHIVSH